MIEFAALYARLDSTTKTSVKITAMADYFAAATPADAAWATYFLSGRKLQQLVPTRLLRDWAAEAAEIPQWLFEESYHAVGDLAETISLVVPPGTCATDDNNVALSTDTDTTTYTATPHLQPPLPRHHERQHLQPPLPRLCGGEGRGEGVSQSGTQDSGPYEQVFGGPLSELMETRLQPLKGMAEADQREAVIRLWDESPVAVRFVMMKLITGAFRVGVSNRLVTRAIAQFSGISVETVAHRLMGDWQPTADFFQRVVDPDASDTRISQPYPFALAHAIDNDTGPEPLGDSNQFVAEWKWDGIRGQLIRRGEQTFIWSRGEDLMENRWPEIEAAAARLPDGTVLDGEILAARDDGSVLPFAQLQRRIGRKTVGKKLLAEVPVRFYAFDLLELSGEDLRERPHAERRRELEAIVVAAEHPQLVLTELLTGKTWAELAELRRDSRARFAEGLMLKRSDGRYEVGRVRGSWWKWKIDPYTIDAVLIYAQRGHGRRASLYSDYTFALWKGAELVPFAKAYSGLDDQEIRKVDRFVRQHTTESFGPVRSVQPELVMELAFEGLQRSGRHKSGVATRFPRILRWRHDKQAKDANTLDELLALLPAKE